MNVNHVTNDGAMGVVERALQRAAKADKWMAAVWAVEDGNINLIDRTTWQFPTGDFNTAIHQLRSVCDEEISRSLPVDDPLPLAVLNEAGFASKEPVKEINIDDVNKELDELGDDGFGPVDGFDEPVEEEEDVE